MVPKNWIEAFGRLQRLSDTSLVFKGGKTKLQDGADGQEVGLFLCDQWFSEGRIAVDVSFDGVADRSAGEIILYYDPQTRYTLNAGLTSFHLFGLRTFDNRGWTPLAVAGLANAIQPQRSYRLEATLAGSTVSLAVDGVQVLKAALPGVLPRSQVGVFGVNEHDITFSNFEVFGEEPSAFVVMQFSEPYHAVYSEVIQTVCLEEGISVSRIDEVSGPGVIIEDIARAIQAAKFVIADITPTNANVFYEVGYAHALNKPTILLAEKGTKLPFDVSPFRTLFYENSIGGKRHFEESLRKHIRASLEKQPVR